MTTRGYPRQAVWIDRCHPRPPQARRSRRAQATGAWLVAQRVLVVTGAATWLGIAWVALGRLTGWWGL